MFLFETRRTVSSETPLRRIIVIIFSIYSLPNLFTSENSTSPRHNASFEKLECMMTNLSRVETLNTLLRQSHLSAHCHCTGNTESVHL
jgi:hypothetical protein